MRGYPPEIAGTSSSEDGSTQTLSPLRQSVVARCEAELERWRHTRADPTREPWCSIIGDYWRHGLGIGRRDGRTVYFDETGRRFLPAWSAAFVSYIYRSAGAGDAMHYSEAHIHFIMASLRAARAGTRQSFLARDPEHHAPRAGDLICMVRNRRYVTIHDLEQLYGSAAVPCGHFIPCHSDIVVEAEIASGQVRTIGGNLGKGLVGERIWETDSYGRLLSRSLCIIECTL